MSSTHRTSVVAVSMIALFEPMLVARAAELPPGTRAEATELYGIDATYYQRSPDSLEIALRRIDAVKSAVESWRDSADVALRSDSGTFRSDSVFLVLRNELRDLLYRETRAFYEPYFQALIWPEGPAADYLRRTGRSDVVTASQVAFADSLRGTLIASGIHSNHAEGTMYFSPSDSALLAWFGSFVTPQIVAFLRMEVEEQRAPMADDASLMIKVDQLSRRVVHAEQVLTEHPTSPAVPLVRYRYHQYLAAYLGGLPNSSAFHWRTREMIPEFRSSYAAFVREYGSTRAGRVLREYVALLRASRFIRTPEIDRFLQARWAEVR